MTPQDLTISLLECKIASLEAKYKVNSRAIGSLFFLQIIMNIALIACIWGDILK